MFVRQELNQAPEDGAAPTPRRRPSAGLAGLVARGPYAVWALASLALLMTCAVLLAFILPWLSWRRASTRFFARSWLVVAGLRVLKARPA